MLKVMFYLFLFLKPIFIPHSRDEVAEKAPNAANAGSPGCGHRQRSSSCYWHEKFVQTLNMRRIYSAVDAGGIRGCHIAGNRRNAIQEVI